ncbi:MAG: aminotransferase class I/II-fold pyridoxal phosphate-dependent enzyme, partial [Mariprofundales bacterium]|nr:aminotransferase class I/II-fold pyridoxal phosphate-dependent enzyme [Mariprofundales bacterium]
RPVVVDTTSANQFKITPAELERAVTNRSRLLVINSPSNPTGMAYSADELRSLGEVVRHHPQLAVVSDDMYEKILFDDREFVTFAQINPDLAERTITCNGLSKAWCMTGWRIGFCAGPRHLIAAMTKIQGQSTSNPNSIAQRAALAALTGRDDSLNKMVATYSTRRRWLVQALNAIEGITCLMPDGAFYTFPDISSWLGRSAPQYGVIADDVALCSWLLESAGVALVPGSAFGAPGFVRLSYAIEQERLEEAVTRITSALATLR